MANYDFTKLLSALDFEILSKDLLEAELGVALEHFAEGRDKGIDLRYAAVSAAKLRNLQIGSPPLIVQCKRHSNYRSLKSELKRTELPKVRILKPIRYLLTTSVSLSVQQVDELKMLLDPYILSTGDIYGRERLNSLLSKHQEIERRHIKLWASSAGVLDTFLNARTHTV